MPFDPLIKIGAVDGLFDDDGAPIYHSPFGLNPDDGPAGGVGGGEVGTNNAFYTGQPILLPAAMVEPRFVPEFPGPDLNVIVYDATGFRRTLAQIDRRQLSYQLDKMGGFGQGQIVFKAAAGVQRGDRVDVFCDDHHLYRGYVAERYFTSDLPPSLQATLYGRATQFTVFTIDEQLYFPAPVDASVVARAIWAAGVELILPWLTTDFPPIGVPIVGAFGTPGDSVSDLFTNLANVCGDLTGWGCGRDGDGVDQGYFRRNGDLTQTDYTVDTDSTETGQVTGGDSSADTFNIVEIVGGDLAPYDNKVPNGGFESVVPGGKGVGQLLLNADFEQGLLGPDPWTLFGGASRKLSGDGSGDAQSGVQWIETDDLGEGFYQEFDLPTGLRGTALAADWYVQPEDDDGLAFATIHLAYRDATSGDWTEDDTANDWVGQPKLATYQYVSYLCPANPALSANADKVRISITQNTSTTPGAGIRWDNFTVWGPGLLYQQGWGVTANGTSELGSVDGAYQADRMEGGYCFRLTVTAASDDDDDDVRLMLTGDSQFVPVIGGQPFRLTNYFKAGPDAISGQLMRFVVQYFKADKTSQTGNTAVRIWDGSNDATDWTMSNLPADAPEDAAYALFWLAARSAGDWLIDAISFRDGRAPWGPTLPYQPAGPFRLRIRAAQTYSTDSDDPVEAVASFSEIDPAVGPRTGKLSAEILAAANFTDIQALYQQAYDLARAFFRARSLPSWQVSVPITGQPARPYWPGSSVRLIGALGDEMHPTDPLPPGMAIASVRGTTDSAGVLSRTLDLGTPVPTDESLIMQTAVNVAISGGK